VKGLQLLNSSICSFGNNCKTPWSKKYYSALLKNGTCITGRLKLEDRNIIYRGAKTQGKNLEND
jgi:hypothetical protein